MITVNFLLLYIRVAGEFLSCSAQMGSKLAGEHSVGVIRDCTALVMQHNAAGKMSGTGAGVGRCLDFIIIEDLCRVLLNLRCSLTT